MSLRPILSESLFSIEFTGIPECLTKDRQMDHGSKSQILLSMINHLPRLKLLNKMLV